MSQIKHVVCFVVACGWGTSVLAVHAKAEHIVWTSWFNPVMGYDLASGEVRQLASDVMSTASTPDPSHNAIYYSRTRGISKTDSSGNQAVTVLEAVPPPGYPGRGPYYGEVGAPHGIAVDERTGDLYWAEALFNPGNGWDMRGIRRLDADTGQVEVMLELDGVTPLGLYFDQPSQTLYFTAQPTVNDEQAAAEGSIKRFRLSDRHVEDVYAIDSSFGETRAITADLDTGQLFWVANRRNINVGTLDGAAKERVLLDIVETTGSRCHLQSLFYYPVDEKLYFGTGCSIGRVNTDGSGLEILVDSEHVQALSSMAIFDPQLALLGVPEPSTLSMSFVAWTFVSCLACQHRRRRRSGE